MTEIYEVYKEIVDKCDLIVASSDPAAEVLPLRDLARSIAMMLGAELRLNTSMAACSHVRVA
jgi:hypothetical protein